WFLPLLGTGVLVAVGLLAEWRREAMASGAFLAGAVLSLVPATLAMLGEAGWLGFRPKNMVQLLDEPFSNRQVLVACLTALTLSAGALARLRLTGFAWTGCLLG